MSGTCGYFNFFMKKAIFCIYKKLNFTRLDNFNKPGPEISYFYNETGVEEAFWTTTQYRKPQMPSSGHHSLTGHTRQKANWDKEDLYFSHEDEMLKEFTCVAKLISDGIFWEIRHV